MLTHSQWRRNTLSKQSFGGGGGEAIDHKQCLPPPPPQKKKKKKKPSVSSEHSGAYAHSQLSLWPGDFSVNPIQGCLISNKFFLCLLSLQVQQEFAMQCEELTEVKLISTFAESKGTGKERPGTETHKDHKIWLVQLGLPLENGYKLNFFCLKATQIAFAKRFTFAFLKVKV